MAVRDAVAKFHGGRVIPEDPAKVESQSNDQFFIKMIPISGSLDYKQPDGEWRSVGLDMMGEIQIEIFL